MQHPRQTGFEAHDVARDAAIADGLLDRVAAMAWRLVHPAR